MRANSVFVHNPTAGASGARGLRKQPVWMLSCTAVPRQEKSAIECGGLSYLLPKYVLISSR